MSTGFRLHTIKCKKQFYFKQFSFASIQFQCEKQFNFGQFSLAWVRSLNVKTVLVEAIQFNISTQFISIWPIDRNLSGANTADQCGPGSDGNEGILRIFENSSIAGSSL